MGVFYLGRVLPISYPESSGSLASGWSPGENDKFFFEFSSLSPGDQLLAKEPVVSGYETGVLLARVEAPGCHRHPIPFKRGSWLTCYLMVVPC